MILLLLDGRIDHYYDKALIIQQETVQYFTMPFLVDG